MKLVEGWVRWAASQAAFVCARRACVWAAAYEISDYEMAADGGELAKHDRDELGVGFREVHG